LQHIISKFIQQSLVFVAITKQKTNLTYHGVI